MLNIVLSGGPCSGKTTSISKIEEELNSKLGIHTLICPETATELIANGIYPGKNIPVEDFQEIILKKQLEKEKLYKDIASKYFDPDKTIIIYDRGILDQLAYIDRTNFDNLLNKYNLTISDIINRYDAVIHLTTAAKGTTHYTTENNSARKETAEEAIALDDRTLAGNTIHPHLRVIDNSTNFEKKIQRVLKVIFDCLGEPTPSEIERKFLIKYPDKNILENLNFSSKSEIIQTYLKSEGNIERRIRQRGTKENGYNFYYTEKESISGIKRIEKEKKITVKEYVNLLIDANPLLHQISKTRYCFVYENQYFELDIYPYSIDHAILEIELSDENDNIKMPPFLEVIKEVTDDIYYKNSSIAKTLKI